MRARQTVERTCDGIPKDWRPPADGAAYTAEEAEGLARRDRRETGICAGAALNYADHIKRRDRAIMKATGSK